MESQVITVLSVLIEQKLQRTWDLTMLLYWRNSSLILRECHHIIAAVARSKAQEELLNVTLWAALNLLKEPLVMKW